MYDVLIVGAGAAGLSAAIYTTRNSMKTLVVSMDKGGQTILTNNIENYPGATNLSGLRLMEIFYEQAEAFGTEFVFGKVMKIRKEKHFFVEVADGTVYEAKSVIITAGKEPKILGIKGEEALIGKGVSSTATVDLPDYKGKTVVCVGGGNSGVEAALYATELCSKAYLVHRREEFRAEQITVDKLKASSCELMLNYQPVEVKGTDNVEALVVEHVETKERKEIPCDAVFMQVGLQAPHDMTDGMVEMNAKREILTDNVGRTKVEGLFAAGDVTDVPYKQTIVSAGEGVKAAMEAIRFVTGKKVLIDWTH